MTYATPAALRKGLEARLQNRSQETGVSLDRLRRRVVFERVIARLQRAEPGRWVLKGGMALEVRLGDEARLTKDIDLGLRDQVLEGEELHVRLIEALSIDLDGDGFELEAGRPERLQEEGPTTWRVRVAAVMAGRLFGSVKLDVSPRPHELDATETVVIESSLDFANVPTTTIEIVDVHRHAAEKLHAMLRDHGDRENTRVRDLVDVVILLEHDQLEPHVLAGAVVRVWQERDGVAPPGSFPDLPAAWPDRYAAIVAELDLSARSFTDAVDRVDRLWTEMFPMEVG